MTPSHDTPSPLALCVADANILFDLRNGRILMDIAALPYRFIVPDAVWAELDTPLRSMVQSLGFEIGTLEAEAVSEIYSLRPEYPRLSVADLFAFFVARDRQAMLLTGDTRLKRLAEIRGLVVHGTLWVLDELFERQALSDQGALIALERILALGGRLPASECQKRRLQWK
ncbi:MAG: PIN domain-containing protein [Anaerolineae bacterium]